MLTAAVGMVGHFSLRSPLAQSLLESIQHEVGTLQICLSASPIKQTGSAHLKSDEVVSLLLYSS
ncbi:hypothetical protein GGR01_003832 [Acetobacter oeni]|nr:hypothetical protein [Acetobacter oeni]